MGRTGGGTIVLCERPVVRLGGPNLLLCLVAGIWSEDVGKVGSSVDSEEVCLYICSNVCY